MFHKLLTEEFIDSLGTHSTADSLRRALLRSKEVQEIRELLIKGVLNEESIQRFIAAIMPDFRRGESFVHEMALSAIAVALEVRNTSFAEEYLIDLAGTSIIEFAICRRVAGLSAKAWLEQPRIEKISTSTAKSSPHKYANRISKHFEVKPISEAPNDQPSNKPEFRKLT